jgi:hypothetical protein
MQSISRALKRGNAVAYRGTNDKIHALRRKGTNRWKFEDTCKHAKRQAERERYYKNGE